MITKNTRMLLLNLLKSQIVLQSWGITNIVIRENELSFNVNGFNYSSSVTIISNETNYTIKLSNQNFAVDLSNLVTVLDQIIEGKENYEMRLEQYVKSIVKYMQ